MTVIPIPLNDLPVFSEDVEAGGDPDAVVRWKDAIMQSDALLFASPEYNSSVSGVLKNAIDWASRKHGQHRILQNKPAAIVGASTGRLGTALSQKHLRQILSHIGAQVLTKPNLYVSNAGEEWTDGTGYSAGTTDRLRKVLEALVRWTDLLRDYGSRT